ncbi:MAG TPA: hypothetical protein VEF06_04180, partial [Bryobacteraceae bacterium]|nr:hypothetical protein [Bryobacteraceae bacterium]
MRSREGLNRRSRRRAAHAGGGLVENADERGSAVGEDGLHQFEIADGDGVEDHGVGAVEVARRVEVVERGALRVSEIVQHGARRRDGEVLPGESEA